MQNLRSVADNCCQTLKIRVWLLVGIMFLLGSCRTLDCGCPMVLESNGHKNRESRKFLEGFSGVNYYSVPNDHLVR